MNGECCGIVRRERFSGSPYGDFQPGKMNPKQSAPGKRVLLLFTTTGYQAAAFKEAAEKLDVALVGGSDRCKNLEDPWRDGAIPRRFQNPPAAAEAIIRYARQQPLDAIIAIGDKPTLTAALA